MPYLNRIILMGHAGKAPEIKSTQSGLTIASFGLATDDGYFRGSEWQSKVTWHNCVVMGKPAERLAANPFDKGDTVMVEGSVVDNSYEKDGKPVKRVEVRCQSVKLVKVKQPKPRQESIIPPQLDEDDSSLPF